MPGTSVSASSTPDATRTCGATCARPINSLITRDAVEDLELAEGSKVIALAKATEVSLAVE